MSENNHIGREFIKYTGLNVLGMIGLSCYILADTFFVSKAMGTNGLAALNLAISVYSLISATGLMLGIGGATRFSIFHIQGNQKEGRRGFTRTVLLGLMAGAVFFAAGVLAAPLIAGILGANGDILGDTAVYLRVILCFAPCFIMNNILLAFVRNDGNTRISMAAMLTGSMANIILDYVFMFPFSMGMFGAAFATGLAPVISMGVLALHLFSKKSSLHLRSSKWRWKEALSILSPGVSSFVTEMSSGVVLIVFNLVILRLAGNTGVAAYGIVANLALVVTAVFTGIAQGIQPLVSRGYGAGDGKMLNMILRSAMVLSLSLAVGIYISANLCSGTVIAVFNSEGSRDLAMIAERGIRLYFAGFLFAGLNIVSAAFLSAVMETGKAFGVSAIRGCAAIIPLAVLLPMVFGMDGVWMAFVLAEMAACGVSARGLLGFGRSFSRVTPSFHETD